MTDLNTDQRLAFLLMDLLPQVGQQHAAAEKNAHALALYPAAAKVQQHVATRYDEVGDRLADVIEALAAGTLRLDG